jgi:4-hydroxy 2-oxovalerate aldolase
MIRRLLRRTPSKKAAPKLERPVYAERHAGRTLLVLGNGPSLARHREALLDLAARRNAIVLGANNITPFTHPDYHAFTNRKRFVEYAGTVDPEHSRVLVGAYLPTELVERHVAGDVERIMYVNDHDARFDVVDGVIQASCRTVSVLLIGVAAVMGASEILVAGLDGFPEGERGRAYHADTRVLKPDEQVQRQIQAYTTRFLGEIQAWLGEQGRAPFAIVTPTVYERHHRTGLLGAGS